MALFDLEGNRVNLSASASPLFDEQETVPEKTTYYDSAYFDEIYHPRTAWEHIRGIEPYEISHPPLGKLIMGVGIRLFGMTPFGWRFMGTLFGVGMLPCCMCSSRTCSAAPPSPPAAPCCWPPTSCT